ncbi:MAG: phospholipase C [Bacteriovoracales bacterium]
MQNLKIILYFFVTILFLGNTLAMGIKIQKEDNPDCSKGPGNRPFPNISTGLKNKDMPFNHLIVIMQENHSFDHYFGKLNQPKFYGDKVDGVMDSFYNTYFKRRKHYSFHSKTLCLTDPAHQYKEMHKAWNEGKNDRFVKSPGGGFGEYVMAYFDETDLPFYYSLANNFAIADRYFASGLTGTHPNRLFLLSGTAGGEVTNNGRKFTWKTIFEVLNEHKISWKYYRDGGGYLYLFKSFHDKNLDKIKSIADYDNDVRNKTLPAVSFVDAPWDETDEHPAGGNIQRGQKWVGDRITPIMAGDLWKDTVIFLTYDEGGAFYDHVPPPKACLPDDKKNKKGHWQPDRYGFRVPFTAISAFVQKHYVSHMTYDHSSVLKFIQTWYNLPALTKRDANANNLLDLFNFKNPNFENPLPYLTLPVVDPKKVCEKPHK